MRIKESKNEIVEALLQNPTIVGLVRKMNPVDLIKIMLQSFDLQPQDACDATYDLIKQTHDVHYNHSDLKPEGLLGINGGVQFPIPKQNRKLKKFVFTDDQFNGEEMEVDEVGKIDITPRYDIKRYNFPPDPVGKPDEWPYDAFNVAIMKNNPSGKKRPLMNSADNNKLFKDRERLDIAKDQPGMTGRGIHAKRTPHCVTGDKKGWASAQDEFDMPDNFIDKPKPLVTTTIKFIGGNSTPKRGLYK